jgi:hypothetical protein
MSITLRSPPDPAQDTWRKVRNPTHVGKFGQFGRLIPHHVVRVVRLGLHLDLKAGAAPQGSGAPVTSWTPSGG